MLQVLLRQLSCQQQVPHQMLLLPSARFRQMLFHGSLPQTRNGFHHLGSLPVLLNLSPVLCRFQGLHLLSQAHQIELLPGG